MKNVKFDGGCVSENNNFMGMLYLRGEIIKISKLERSYQKLKFCVEISLAFI